MGLAASQARMLLLVARKSDLEYRGQMINQRRMNLAWQTEALAKEYTDAMSNRSLKLKTATTTNNTTTTTNITGVTSSALYAKGFNVVDGNNRIVYSTNNDSARIEEGLRSGVYHLASATSQTSGGTNTNEKIDWRSNVDFDDQLDSGDDEEAKAKYEYESLKLQTQDKALEIELKNVDTQHQAVQTEYDAVKKVIDKNIETSFKTFG